MTVVYNEISGLIASFHAILNYECGIERHILMYRLAQPYAEFHFYSNTYLRHLFQGLFKVSFFVKYNSLQTLEEKYGFINWENK